MKKLYGMKRLYGRFKTAFTAAIAIIITISSVGLYTTEVLATTQTQDNIISIVYPRRTTAFNRSEFISQFTLSNGQARTVTLDGTLTSFLDGDYYSLEDFFDIYTGWTFRYVRSNVRNVLLTTVSAPAENQVQTATPSTTSTAATPATNVTTSVTTGNTGDNIADMVQELHAIRSTITIPNRVLTTAEINTWIAEYNELDGSNAWELELIRLVNIERTSRGLNALVVDETLMMAARFKGQSTVHLSYLSHTGVHGSPTDLAGLFGWEQTGRLAGVGENLSRGRSTPQAAVESWMNSEGHRNNILNPDYATIGAGMYLNLRDNGTRNTAWVLMFH